MAYRTDVAFAVLMVVLTPAVTAESHIRDAIFSDAVPGGSGVLSRMLVPRGMADAPRVVQERAGDELSRRSGDLLGEQGELPLGAGTGHAAPASSSR